MLALDSPTWATIPSSPGGTGLIAAQLLRQIRGGDDSGYGELFEQVCHQFSVGAVAYLVVPHLVEIARSRQPLERVRPLAIVGSVAAARLADPRNAAPMPPEWAVEYEAANAEARELAADALGRPGWRPSDSQELVATAAALHGHADLAMHLFLQGGATDLSCPSCGEYITFGQKD
jgi:hypothetical protein